MYTKFRFKTAKLNAKILFLESRWEFTHAKSRKAALQFLYGNLIEISNVKCAKICEMDIPADHKKIAWNIRNEEVEKIRTEFDARIIEEGLVEENYIGNFVWKKGA